MTNKSLILNLYNQSINYLDLTFLDSNLIDLVKTKEEFRKIVTNLLTFVIDCEDNELVEQKNQQRLLAAFNTITGTEFSPNTTITFKSDSELELEVSSFDEYLVKNLNKNFEEIKSEFKSQHTEEPVKVESEVVGVATASDLNNEGSAGSNENKEFDAEEFINNNKMNINEMAESMITSAANSMLIANIRKGTVYQYKTKPKVIPILKWCIVGIVAVLIALSIASFSVLTVAFTTDGKFTISVPNKDQNLPNDEVTGALGRFSIPFQLILGILILALMISSMIKNNKNENFKYFMSWGWMLIYTSTLIFVWFLTESTIMFRYNQWIDANNIIREKSVAGLHLLDVYRIIEFVILGLLGTIIIILIVGCVMNPKRDIERLQLLLQQYVNDIKSGSIPFDGGMNDFGRFMGSLF